MITPEIVRQYFPDVVSWVTETEKAILERGQPLLPENRGDAQAIGISSRRPWLLYRSETRQISIPRWADSSGLKVETEAADRSEAADLAARISSSLPFVLKDALGEKKWF